jgi:hypothetical protein
MRNFMVCTTHKLCWCKIQKNKMGGACSEYGEGIDVFRVLVRKREGKGSLGRPRNR